MIKFQNGGVLVQTIDDLPTLPDQIGNLFFDTETTSGRADLDSLDPWHNCAILGYSFCWDDAPGSYYVPLRHQDGNNVALEPAMRYLKDMVERSTRMVGHNVKYDMHVYSNDPFLGALPTSLQVACTVVQSQLIDSDRGYGRGTYGLESLSEDWLGEDIRPLEMRLKAFTSDVKNKDYAAIPTDIGAEYACQDPISTRRLYNRNEIAMHSECRTVWATEQKLTKLLWKMERRGVRVDMGRLRVAELQTRTKMIMLESFVSKKVGRAINPASTQDVYDVLINHYGLPVLSYTHVDDDGNVTEDSNPSFNKEAMKLYLVHPEAPKDVVQALGEYRKLSTFLGLCCTSWQEKQIDGVLHPNHRQCVRTGRMACRNPNTQQCNKLMKALILAREGYTLLSNDYSQIEYRTIAHYTQNPRIIKAYNDDPDVDFHQRIADMCGVQRRAAKTINFMVGFGGGKKKTVRVLSVNQDVVADVERQVDAMVENGSLRAKDRVEEFHRLCRIRGLQFYERYHGEFPELKATSRDCAAVCATRGYVRNVYGRHRHLPRDHAHKAFNSINQSSAADVCKERMVALDEETSHVALQVHDDIISEVPTESLTPEYHRRVLDILENPAVTLRVPIRCSAGVSRPGLADGGPKSACGNWAEASDEKHDLEVDSYGKVKVRRRDEGENTRDTLQELSEAIS